MSDAMVNDLLSERAGVLGSPRLSDAEKSDRCDLIDREIRAYGGEPPESVRPKKRTADKPARKTRGK